MDAPLPAESAAGRRSVGIVGVALGGLAAGVAVPALGFLVWFYWREVLGLLVVAALVSGVAFLTVTNRRRVERERAAELRGLARLERVDVMSGDQFEELTARLLERDDFRRVEVVGRAGDRGVDVLALAPDGRELAVQCKRQARAVTADRVRNLIGAVHSTYAGRVGVLVTNNHFTAQARDEARGRLVLVDRDDLARWMDGEPLAF
ncbi:restriction endonuclease [Actinomadura rupiterrae]|uniref:restriction endonuclease n=1 Tax=Actinomadura rupiterrae TaxID=559627 RepID=UPI0020A42F47|nr:restriction endonuclease [Actinomadura rupiterrae]MCP2334719.1 restriction system protein [Actinomadura rupiterrae]